MVFNGGYKCFGIEVHIKDLDKLKYVWADLAYKHPGYELPHLIDLTDKILKRHKNKYYEKSYKSTIFKNTPKEHNGNGLGLNDTNERILR